MSAFTLKKCASLPSSRAGRSRGENDITTKEIEELLKDKAAKSFVARRLRVSRTTLIDYIKTRGLER